jgi:uncharacterized lipoprotein YddW (UPF0748 family)
MPTCLALVASLLAQPVEHRGVWLHPEQFRTPAECDRFVERMAAARLNVAYALVWYWGGTAYYRSALCPLAEGLPEGYDPLGYLIERAHARGIQVHAWFVNGAYGRSDLGYVFKAHPEWRLQPAPGQYAWWYDLGQPEVRAFETQVMLEVLQRYPVDGLHFDYIRYDGPQLCFCPHCREEFRRLYGHDLRLLGGEAFPLTVQLSANPLDKPSSARVLVRVAGGPAAIALNELGRGQVLLFNWHVERSHPPAVETVLRRFLEAAGKQAGCELLLYEPQPTLEKYGPAALGEASEWVRSLGYRPKRVAEGDLAQLPTGAVLLLVTAYYLPDEAAEQLGRFVEQGGRVVVLDGPVHSIAKPAVQRLLGFTATASYYYGPQILEPATASPWIPTGGQAPAREQVERMSADWARYRCEGVTQLVRQVYQGAKAIKPQVAISAAVFYRVAAASNVFQDWPRWLREGFLDYVLPMAYLTEDQQLTEALAEYKTLDPQLARIIPGLSLYMRQAGGVRSRPPELVLRQVDLCRQAGARGVNFFALAYLDDNLISALSTGPFATPAKPYVPLLKGP